MPLIFTTRASKQNQHGCLETIRVLRNKKPPFACLVVWPFTSSTARTFSEEAFSDFSKRSAWYDIQLIKGTTEDPKAAFSYNSQRDWGLPIRWYILAQKGPCWTEFRGANGRAKGCQRGPNPPRRQAEPRENGGLLP